MEYGQNLKLLYFDDIFINEQAIIPKESTFESASKNENVVELSLQMEVNEFEAQLKILDKTSIVFGLELGTISTSNNFNQIEFGVESLWCHHALNLNPDESFSLDFQKHRWGTAIAIGCGLAQVF